MYSGSFLGQVEVDNHDVTRLTMGIHPDQFTWTLQQGKSFVTPEAVLAYSDNGMNALSQTYHKLYQSRLARGVWRVVPKEPKTFFGKELKSLRTACDYIPNCNDSSSNDVKTRKS